MIFSITVRTIIPQPLEYGIAVTLHFISTSSLDDRVQLINRNDIAMLSALAEAALIQRVQLPLRVVPDCPPRPGLMASDAPAAPPAS